MSLGPLLFHYAGMDDQSRYSTLKLYNAVFLCILYSVHCTVYIVKQRYITLTYITLTYCTLYSMLKLYNAVCILYTVQCTRYTLNLYNAALLCILYKVQYVKVI